MIFQNLRYVDLSQNNFSGHVELLALPAARYIDFSQNNISSVSFRKFNPALDHLRGINLGNNLIEQSVNEVLQNVPRRLIQLILSGNNIQGELPNPFPNLPDLTKLAMGDNNLTGTIPENYVRLGVSVLDLSRNALTGKLPYLGRLETLILKENLLTGTIPTGFGGTAGTECK